MLFNSRRVLSLAMLFLFVAAVTVAQTEPASISLAELKKSAPPATPSAADIMRSRISKAKAYLVVKNYTAAIYELENLRLETQSPEVHRVINVLLMHSYLEQSDYKKAKSFLKELNKDPKKTADYYAVAGQVVSGARTQLARYEALGLAVGDANMHKAATLDLDGMRETLELIVKQSKVKGQAKQAPELAVVVLEESSAARKNLARDEYDAKRWNDQIAEAREQIVSPRTKIIDAVEKPVNTPGLTLVATKVDPEVVAATPADETVEETPEVTKGDTVISDVVAASKDPEIALKPVAKETQVQSDVSKPKVVKEKVAANTETSDVVKKTESGPMPKDRTVRVIKSDSTKPDDDQTAKLADAPDVQSTDQIEKGEADKKLASPDDTPLMIGALLGYATKRVNPVYPRQARSMRMTGTVKVEVIIGEDGKVAKVANTSGPSLLRRAAQDAVKKWKFRPFEKDGQPVKASGYVSFNFNL